MKFTNLRIGFKLTAGMLVVALLVLLVGAVGYYGLKENELAIGELGAVRLRSVQIAGEMQQEVGKIAEAMNTLLAPFNSLEERAQLIQSIGEAQERFRQARDVYEALPRNAEEAQAWEWFTEQLARWTEVNGSILALHREFEQVGILNPDSLMERIQTFRGDHLFLVMQVSKMLIADATFDGGEDHVGCAFGQWLGEFVTENLPLQDAITEISSAHVRLHQAAATITAFAGADKQAAMNMFRISLQPAAEEFFRTFELMIVEVRRAAALQERIVELTTGEMRACQNRALSSLDAIVATNAELSAHEVDSSLARAATLKTFIGAVAVSGLIAAVLLGLVISRSIALPLRDCVAFTGLLAQGDFSGTPPEEARRRGDEIGDLARAYHTMVGNVRNLIGDMAESARTLASSAAQMSEVSRHAAHSVAELSSKTTMMAAAGEQLSASIVNVAAGMEQTSTNLSSVATATEEMSATIGEIAGNTERARCTTGDAATQIDAFAQMLREMGVAANEIGKVTEAISGISSQTNLLALNATIEAARAGDAGRGFAVVANEIKELAQQTAGATEDIKKRIASIQDATGGAVKDIGGIVQVIRGVTDNVNSIAGAIEEQSGVTTEVAANITQASAGVQDATVRAAEMASVSKSLSADISGVDGITSEIRAGGENVRGTALELTRLAEHLMAQVGQFKVS